MSKVVQGPNGITITFPDTATDADINKAMTEAMARSSAGGSPKPAAPANVGPRPQAQQEPAAVTPENVTPDQIRQLETSLTAAMSSPMVAAALAGGRRPGEPASATPTPDGLRPRTESTSKPQRDYGGMHYLQAGMRITPEGIETRQLKSDSMKGLTKEQRAALDKMSDYDPSAPPGSRQNPFIAIPGKAATDGSGKREQPQGPVGSYKLLHDGRIVQQETKYDDRLGFDQETTRATNNMFTLLGFEGAKATRQAREDELKRARLAGVEPGAIGSFTGGAIGTLPYVVATRNPYIGGAIGGAVNTRGDTVQEVAGDAALGAATGRLFDMGINATVDTIAPAVKEQVNRLMQSGVKLTPGQILGGPAQRIEDAATSIPILGDLISGAQKRSQESFNTAAINEAIAPANLKLGDVGPDELINRRAPGPSKPPAGTAAKRLEDKPLAIGDQPLALGGPDTPRVGPGKTPADKAVDAAKRAKTDAGNAGDHHIDAELAHREAADAAAAAGDMKLAKAHEDAADLHQKAYDAPDDATAAKASQDAIAASEKLGGAEAKATGSAVTTAVGNVLAKVGIKLPGSVKKAATSAKAGQPSIPGTKSTTEFGHEAIDWAHQQLKIRYNNLLQNTESNLQNLSREGMQEVRKMADDLAPDEAAAYDKFITNYVENRFKGNTIRGDEWKEVDSVLSSEIREFGKSLDPNQRKLANVYRALQKELREMFAKGVEQGRSAAKLPTKSPAINMAVDEVNAKIIADHGKMVDDWIAGGKQGPMPKSPELLKSRPDVPDESYKVGAGGAAVPGNKSFADELRGIDKAFSNLLRIEQAASKAPGGVFTASGLRSAVREMDSTGRKSATARGKAPMQDIAEAGVQTLTKRVPDSGTATRGMINTLAAAGLLGAFPKFAPNPMLLATLGGLMAPYTKAGGAAVRTAMTRRPAWVNRLRPVLEKATERLAGAGAGGVAGLRGRQDEDQPNVAE